MRAVCCVLAVSSLLAGCGRWLRTSRHAPPCEGLAVGQAAPEIEGTDLDGVPFKLSDYRGKVVVLDFWGHW
jgi:cytochrome oxidase Cu insertion factor (SCO1/SenC/PrrC family)